MVVLLLFMLGLEYSAEELTANLRSNLPAGLPDAAVNFGIGLLAGLALGWGFTAAFLLGGATYISSSGVIAKVLDDSAGSGTARPRACSRCSCWRTWRWPPTCRSPPC